MAKPDDRSNNAERLRNAVQHTQGNLEEAEEYLDEHADEIGSEEAEAISDKNARRRHAIEGMESEIEDES